MATRFYDLPASNSETEYIYAICPFLHIHSKRFFTEIESYNLHSESHVVLRISL
jgi:hypothetical protein